MAEMPEVATKIRWWKRSAAWRRLAADGGAFSVGSVAAVISWKHIVHTSLMLHQDSLAAFLYPISIDGMMIVGVVKAADDRASGRKVRGWARVATWAGGMLSVNAQVMSAWSYGYLASAWSIVPSATLIIVVEVMARRGKLLPVELVPTVSIEVATVPAVAPVEVPTVAPVAPVEPMLESAPVVIETEQTDPITEDVKPANRRPRRARQIGHPGTGATGVQIDAAIEATPVRDAEIESADV